MSNTFKVKYDEVRSTVATEIPKHINEIQTMLTNTTNVMNSLTGEHWVSAGSDEVITMFKTTIEPKCKQFCEVLREYQSTITTQANQYEAAEISATQSLVS